MYQDSKQSKGENKEWYRFLGFLLTNCELDSSSQIYQDLWILFETNLKRSGFFVEFGVLDGIKYSNTLLLEKTFGWSGIICEPNPLMLDSILKNRFCIVDARCVYSSSGNYIDFSCTVNPALSKISSISVDSKERAVEKTVNVLTVTLTVLLIQYHAPPLIDFLSIDTEGAEYPILKQHDWSAYHFRYICVEHNNNICRNDLHDFLVNKGYSRKFSGFSRFDNWNFFNEFSDPT